MDEVLLSLQPHWVKLILDGTKQIEIRKNLPQCDLPFRILIYETKAGRGTVVGECICWQAYQIGTAENMAAIQLQSCLSVAEIKAYAGKRKPWAWYLSHVVEYSQPRPLSDFGIQRAPQSWCYIKKGDSA